jgi:uncharacterized protein (TIGR00159 family)
VLFEDFTERLLLTYHELVEHVRWADAIDILVCAVLVYALLAWLRQRASYAVATALLAAGALYLTAHLLDMYLTLLLFRVWLTVLLVTLVVVFQEDLRRAVERFFSWRPWNRRAGELGTEVVDALVEAVEDMAERKVGALIVLRGREPVEPHCRGGIPLGGQVSTPLLQSIFHPKTPGHDGALVLAGPRVERFAVHLPLSSNLGAVGGGGTRHAAALGLAERCDALVVVVSEERGTISVAHERRLNEVEGAAELRGRIGAFRERNERRFGRSFTSRLFFRGAVLKLVSLLIAAVLWFTLAYRVETEQRVFEQVPVVVRNLPESWAVEDIEPGRVRVLLTGTERAFGLLDEDDLSVTIDLAAPTEGVQPIQITDARLDLPAGLTLSQSDPERVWMRVFPVRTVRLPVRVETTGSPPAGLALGEATTSPSSVAVVVSRDRAERIEESATVEVDVSRINLTENPAHTTAPLRLPDGARLATDQPDAVNVAIPWQRRPATETPDNPPANEPGER